MERTHERSASDRTVQPGQADQDNTVSPAAEEASDTPIPAASLFLGQQRVPGSASGSPVRDSSLRANVSMRAGSASTAAATEAPASSAAALPNPSNVRHVSAMPMGSVQIPSQHAPISAPLASPAFAQAALGRGRAPTSQPSTFMGSGSPVSKHTAGNSSGSQRPTRQGQEAAHHSMPSTSASLAFTDAPMSAIHGGGTGGNLTETESVLSAGEEDVYQQSNRRGRPTTLHHASSSRPPRFAGGLRPKSILGTKGKSRSGSRSNLGNADSDEDDEVDARSRRSSQDPVTVLPPVQRTSNAGLDDDEVERRDRGEELVRRRMRERKKEKRDAERRERERKRRDQGRAYAGLPKPAGGHRESFALDQPAETIYQERPTFSRRSTDPPIAGDAQPNLPRTSTNSVSTGDPGEGVTPYSSAGPAVGDRFWPPPPTGSSLMSATPTPQSPYFPNYAQYQNRSVSYAPSQTSIAPHRQASERGGFSETDEEPDKVPELPGKELTGEMRRGESHSEADIYHDQTADGAATDSGNDSDDEEDDNEDVEYTLKDRQDAINIEHPFGLPIWKPALYKKNRSVHRNADKELHLAPSIAAERHLLPGNVLWAILFGWWMALVSMTLALVMCLIPFGGVKYGRVIWELGGYLFWPFGKYVERAEDRSFEDVKGYDESTDGEEDTIFDAPQTSALEDVSKTWGRQSGRSTSSTGTVKKPRSRVDLQTRFDESVAVYQSQTAAHDNSLNAREPLLQRTSPPSYGTAQDVLASQITPSGSETEVADGSPKLQSASEDQHTLPFRIRALGRLSYWLAFYLIVAPMMLAVCIICWALIFTIPMAKLLWILLRDMGKEPLALHFRAPSPNYVGNNAEPDNGANGTGIPHLEAGQRAPRHSRKTYDNSRAKGRFLGPNSTIILCTYKAMGFKYYKYTVDGTNIIFINLLPMVAFVIFDFFVIAPLVSRYHLGGFLAWISSQGTMFMLSMLSVIPLSYFIGMGVASISAQSSIGMGAVINATFGSIIEIILYSIALTQAKGQLVEGSIVGSLLAGVLLMPGLSMISGAVRRKEQRFNARSAGVTSTMLIMAIIGILTPTLFYQIYGTFQLTCAACPEAESTETFTCRRCFYEHVDPVDDEFYKTRVQALSFYCAALLVLSYLIGLWFSLRTHASQIWQNQQHLPSTSPHSAAIAQLTQASGLPSSRLNLPNRVSTYKINPQYGGPANFPQRQSMASTHAGDFSFSGTGKGSLPRDSHWGQQPPAGPQHDNLQAITGYSTEEVNRAFQVVAATTSAIQTQQQPRLASELRPSQGLPRSFSVGNNHMLGHMSTPTPGLRRQSSHMHEREPSKGDGGEEHGGGNGGHDAPNWSRFKSYSVLFGCTVLYAIIAEILVDVVDVVLEGSGIPEKFLGISLFALVPNVTEFMNAISFALNGNIALSMEIGSAYALQVCLLQIPAMIAFTYFYGLGKESMIHRAFTLVFPRWDAIAIMFSVFLLTYTYIEARSNYYRGFILVISYLVLMGGFYMAPGNMDNSDDPLLLSANSVVDLSSGFLDKMFWSVNTWWNSLFSR